MNAEAKHPLRAWREKERISLRELARRLTTQGAAISYSSLARIECGLQPPSWAVVETVNEISGGQVAPNDFIGTLGIEHEA